MDVPPFDEKCLVLTNSLKGRTTLKGSAGPARRIVPAPLALERSSFKVGIGCSRNRDLKSQKSQYGIDCDADSDTDSDPDTDRVEIDPLCG